jgi:glycosyltransferase involved in cell wall biosynthesis
MRIWIFQTGEPIHSDQGNPRPMRSMNLAGALVDSGHRVTLWSSAFYHQEKRHRAHEFQKIRINDLLEIRLVPSRGYKRNIGSARLIDHAGLAWNLKKILASEDDLPDVAFVGYPPIEFAYVAGKWLKSRGVPVMLDAKDQWPQVFTEPFPKLIQPLVRLAFSPYFYLGRKVMREASAFCTMSNSFLEWMCEFSGRAVSEMDSIAPLSPMRETFDQRSIVEAIEWWRNRGVVNDNRKRFIFVGNLSQAFDFKPVIDAAQLAKDAGENWQFVICGDGMKTDQLRTAFSGLSNVVLPGSVDRAKVAVLANISVVGLAPYRNTQDFIKSIPNKIIDYLSHGKVIVSPLDGEVTTLIKRHDVGFVYSETKHNKLFDVLKKLCEDDANIARISANAHKTYENYFNGEKVYQELVVKLVMLSKMRLRKNRYA